MSAHDVIVRVGLVVTPGCERHVDVGVVDGRFAALAPDLEGDATREIGMPRNAHPPTVDGAAFDAKAQAAARSSRVDFALWGGLVPGPLDRLDELAARGVAGLKAFMSDSRMDDFERETDEVLWAGTGARRAARPARRRPRRERRDHARARGPRACGGPPCDARLPRLAPRVAEHQAIATAIALAEDTGCALHLVHVSTGRGVAMVAEARARGADVTCETCPHYLVLTDEDAERLGDPLAVWGDIAGAQTLLTLLLTEGVHARGLTPAAVAALTAADVARRFALPGEGRIEVGADADLALVDLGQTWTLEAASLLQRHPVRPFVGRRLTGRVATTLVRAAVAYVDGRPGPAAGRLVTPARARGPRAAGG